MLLGTTRSKLVYVMASCVMCYGAGLLKEQELPRARSLNYDHLMTLLYFTFPHMDFFFFCNLTIKSNF